MMAFTVRHTDIHSWKYQHVFTLVSHCDAGSELTLHTTNFDLKGRRVIHLVAGNESRFRLAKQPC